MIYSVEIIILVY